MKKLVSIAALIMLSLALNAQEYEQSIRKWSDGPITWDNFVESSNNYNVPSFIAYGWRNEHKTVRKGNLRISTYDYFTSMHTTESWVDPYRKSNSLLQFNQMVFDYAEVCRRQLMKEWENNTNNYSFKELSNYYFQKAERFESEAARQCDYGTDSSMVNYYMSQVASQLEEFPQTEAIPEPRRGKIGIGMHVGYGNEFLLGEANTYFPPRHGLKFGWDIPIYRFCVYMDGMLGFGTPTPRDFYNAGYLWEKGRTQRAGNIELGLGYALVDNSWLCLSPFVGIGVGFTDIDEQKGENLTADEKEVDGFRFQAGLMADIKFLRIYDELGQYNENSVRLMAYAARTNLPIPGPSWSVNFGLLVNTNIWLRSVR